MEQARHLPSLRLYYARAISPARALGRWAGATPSLSGRKGGGGGVTPFHLTKGLTEVTKYVTIVGEQGGDGGKAVAKWASGDGGLR